MMSTITHDQLAERAQSRVSVSALDAGLLALRLALGAIFVAHGAQKLFGWFGGPGWEATVEGFSKMGIPEPLAYLVGPTEFFGGLAVLLGVLARLGALGIAIVMLTATLMVHLPNGFFLNSPGGPGIEFTLALFAMALAILLAGPGRIAVGDWEPRWIRGEQ